MKHNRIILSISVCGLAVLFFMLTMTSPMEIGPLGVLLFFTTIYLVIFSIACLGVELLYHLSMKNRRIERKDYLYSAVIAFGPIMMLMARSFGVINISTISLIVVFLVLAEFLVYKKA
ncbi:MAG: hypothetical protein Q4A79_01665 [Candidatus Saccharibacteria bacterium]|nr:hypothetical protein [Candidatus Saccharibacteria bacterium]